MTERNSGTHEEKVQSLEDNQCCSSGGNTTNSLIIEDETNVPQQNEIREKDKICVFHLGEGNQKGAIKLLSKETLAKCWTILELRKERNLRYREVELPLESDDISGFHIECYRKFTALSKSDREKLKEKENISRKKNEQVSTRSASKTFTATTSGVFCQKCIFCSQKEKKMKGVRQKLINSCTINLEKNVKEYAKLLEDHEMLRRIQTEDFVSKEICYHSICRVEYQNRAEAKKKKTIKFEPKSNWHKSRSLHAEAFESLSSFIDEEILKNKEIHLTSDLNSQYNKILVELGGDEFEGSTYTAQKLETKIQQFYGERIQIEKGRTKRGNIIFSSTMSAEEALRKEHSMKTKLENQLRNVAFTLRDQILNQVKRPLPENVKLTDILKGEVDIPETLTSFFKYLICGPDSRRKNSVMKNRRIESISQDVIYAVTSGSKIPPKHLQVGLAMKSITGSKRVLELLNRLGHSISYNAVEELETELTFEATKSCYNIPHDMKADADLGTGLAFDNYDRFVETLSGKDTLHDTVGIAYQFEVDENTIASRDPENDVQRREEYVLPGGRKKRRRTYESIGLEIEPYRKKPKMFNNDLIPFEDLRRKYVPSSYKLAVNRDYMWMMNCATSNEDVPMWVGWNSKKDTSIPRKQKIFYLPQINQSPTSIAVVAETMKRAISFASECNKNSISVTYDLAIAKIAMQLQAEESPKHDKVFVAMGPFHMELAFFGAIGKYIADSGGEYLLKETHIIEKGSINSFLSGKNYKRCKRSHQLLALAFEIKHFDFFLSCSEGDDLAIESLSNGNGENTQEMNDIFAKYDDFVKRTINGEHGETARYWMEYIEMMKLYRLFTRSIRTGDLDLFIYCLPQLTDYCFAMNRINYARWLVRYHDNLLKLENTHPAVYDEFKNGAFSIQRTSKPFSRSPVDLTLESTINADAACQRRGILSLTNSISARQRWAQSHSIRTSVLSHLFEELGIHKKDDITEELKPHKIAKNASDLRLLSSFIEETMNPFSNDITQDELFNISTGKAATKCTSEFLLNIREIGSVAREKFIRECEENPARFEQPIKRSRILSFQSETKNFKVRGLNEKSISTAMMRDLFGSILSLSLENKIDMAEVFRFPLTPLPLSLCHVDGTILKSPKVKLLNELESRVDPSIPTHVDDVIIDGMFFLHLLVDPPKTIGKTAIAILSKVMQSYACGSIHLVFDKVVSPSIKDLERNMRSSSRQDRYIITGPEQTRPSNWIGALRLDSFKVALVEFLVHFWDNDELFTYFESSKILYVTCGDVCYKFAANGETVRKTEVERLFSAHEEADSRMIYHLNIIQAPSNVVIRTVDTDVLIIALGCMDLMPEGLDIWLETGIYSKNTLRFISINSIYRLLGPRVCKALLALHAFTGCDYTACFSRKGKVKPFKILEKNVDVQDAFASITEEDELSEETIKVVEKFVCQLYGMKKLESVDEARLEFFLRRYKYNNQESFNHLKKLDGSSLPPCKKVLSQKIKRTHYIARNWRSATLSSPSHELQPESSGWKLNNNQYGIQWFSGDATPKIINVTITEEQTSEPDCGIDEVEDYEVSNQESDDGDDDTDE